ncbi:MMPL family transporter [Pseudonocardiaceae bacterium YIM PH 21723]|nr:MMPL family transporter [Pseudonocardiaceae bacterium YIM PH 21723]
MARLLYRLGLGAHRRRLTVLLVWVLVLLGAGAGAATLSGATTNAISIPGQESTTALTRIGEQFPAGNTASAKVVIQAPAGEKITTPQHAQAVAALVTKLSILPGVVSATNPLNPKLASINPAQTTAYSTVTYGVRTGEVGTDNQNALLDAVAQARTGGLSVEVTGTAVQPPPNVGGPAEAIGIVVALAVLALTYGSLITAGMNLLSAGIGVGVGVLGITIASGFFQLQSTTPILASMLGLAVGIDYALFIINRYRQELRGGADVGEAVAKAVGTSGSAVVIAGLTVVIALLGLSVAGIPFLTQMGLAAAATIVVAVLVAITLVPAVLSLLGRRVLPRKQRTAAPVSDRGFFRGWITLVTKNRVVAVLLSVLALGAIALPVAEMRTTLVPQPPSDSTQARAEKLINDAFGPGFGGPLIVLVEGDNAVAGAAKAVGAIQGMDDVVFVAPPTPSASGTAALVTVIPKSGPTSADTEKLVADLRDRLSTVDGARFSVTGTTAISVDVAASLNKALPIYLAVVVGLALLLLVLVFRSLLVPLVGVLGFLLTVGASLGATVAVFQQGHLGGLVNLDQAGPLISLTPILVIGILFGLAMDYQIFLVSRMHEAHHRGERPLYAIRTGFRQAAPVVVAAALIMFAVFSGFVPSGEATVKSIAFALAIGIFADAFVVRMVLVPAALALLGESAWWLPSWLRRLPSLDVEGAELDEKPAPDPVAVG